MPPSNGAHGGEAKGAGRGREVPWRGPQTAHKDIQQRVGEAKRALG